MLKRVRDILLTDYIGAVVIAILVADTCRVLVGMIVYPVESFLLIHTKRSVWYGADIGSNFDWNLYTDSIVKLAIHLAAVVVLTWWLYGRVAEPPPKEEASEETP